MAKNRRLGMGLDLLLTGAEGKELVTREKISNSRAREMLEEALKQDEADNFLEAYYLYRRFIDLYEDSSLLSEEGGSLLVSQALNNAAIILYEHGEPHMAYAYLEKSIVIEPDNRVAQSNLEELKKSSK